MSIRIAVYTHCQMNENPCSNQEIHLLFEHPSMGLNLNILKMSPALFAGRYTESVADQTDHFADVFVRENVAYGYDVVTTL